MIEAMPETKRKTILRVLVAASIVSCVAFLPTSRSAAFAQEGSPQSQEKYLLIGTGDSLTHGTLDATNNIVNSAHSYLQLVALALAKSGSSIAFSQPFFDFNENRLMPFSLPTNLAVDGADAFSVLGIEYGPRVGKSENAFNLDYIAENVTPASLSDPYDKVIYPINVLARKPMTQIGAASWLIRAAGPLAGMDNAIVMFWVGNNDSSSSALGLFGENPLFLPIPVDLVGPELDPLLTLLLNVGDGLGALSFEPYAATFVQRNLTKLDDFEAQIELLLSVLDLSAQRSPIQTDILVATLPYYSAVGYLFDSEDIEFYLQKLDPSYTVPPTFARVSEPSVPIADPFRGDRISLLTFGMMYTLMSTGHTAAEVNQALELDGVQRDGLVLSEAEGASIRQRIDGFNQVLATAAASRPNAHLVDIGGVLNDNLAGDLITEVNGKRLTRKWARGGAFSLDGVHPGYTGHALIANFMLEQISELLNLPSAPYALSPVHANDPYVDQDGDGWVPGPGYPATGLTEVLFLFTDPNDADPNVETELPENVWQFISDRLLEEVLGDSQMAATAKTLGVETP